MSEEVITALIAATPPTIAAVLGYLATKRSLRRSVGTSPGLPLAKVIERVDVKVDRVDSKVDRVIDGQAQIRERLARLEGDLARRLWSPEERAR